MGHDIKHCHMKRDRQNGNPPYGDWMRAGRVSKRGLDRKEPPISRSEGAGEEENSRGMVQAIVERGGADAQARSGHFETPMGSQNLGAKDIEISDNLSVKNQVGWDRREKDVQKSRQRREANEGQEGTKSDLVKNLFKTNEEALSRLGRMRKPKEK